jgi:hypothetical protein
MPNFIKNIKIITKLTHLTFQVNRINHIPSRPGDAVTGLKFELLIDNIILFRWLNLELVLKKESHSVF